MIVQWNELARSLEERGIRSGADLERALKAIGLSLKHLDGEALLGVEDVPRKLRSGRKAQLTGVASLLLYFVASAAFPDFKFEEWGMPWLRWAKAFLLAGVFGLTGWTFGSISSARTAKVVENYLAMDGLAT